MVLLGTKLLRKLLRNRREEIIGKCRTFSDNTIRVIKSKKSRWAADHVAPTLEMRNS
jgi:hypothetical protein